MVEKLMDNYKVIVPCMTYNHAPYIEDTMNGFTIQQTTFPYICCIMDDYSSDGEPEIIKKYLHKNFEIDNNNFVRKEETEDYFLIFARHKTNDNCFFAVFLMKYNHYSIKKPKLPYIAEWFDKAKYIAMCEGDDYWTSAHKLQKQVDFLEENSEYTMCFHNALEHFEYLDKPDGLFSEIEDKDYTGIEMFNNWIVPTASVLYRSSVDKSELRKIVLNNGAFIFGDTPLFLTCAHLGKIRGMSDVMSVYRRQKSSITHINNCERYYKQAYHYLEFYKVFGIQYKTRSQWFFVVHMMGGFLKSIKDKESPISFCFVKESLQESLPFTFLAIPWVLFEYIISLLKRRS